VKTGFTKNNPGIEPDCERPWSVTLSATNGFPLANETRVQIANPVSFLVQKILIHGRRNRPDRAKDILYIDDTIETFAKRIDELRAEWTANIQHELHPNSVRSVLRHRCLEQSPIRFVPHRASSTAGL